MKGYELSPEATYLFSVVFSHQRRRLARRTRRSRRSGNTENGLRGSFVGENRHGSGSSITKKSSVTSVSSVRASPVGARETVKRSLCPPAHTNQHAACGDCV